MELAIPNQHMIKFHLHGMHIDKQWMAGEFMYSSTQWKEFSYSHVPETGKYNSVYDKPQVKPLVASKVGCYQL